MVVVVIDDDESSAEAISDVLADAGFEVRVTNDGRSGLAALRELGGTAVAVIDLMLPDVDGWELIERLRADVRTRRIPVVTCSAAIIDEPPADTIFVGKPFTIAQLVDAVEMAAARVPKAATTTRSAPRAPTS
jgi:CheY-like chemotaxis protein